MGALQITIATFTGAEPLDGDFPYVEITFAEPYDSADDYEVFYGANVDDENAVALRTPLAHRTATGLRVYAPDQFTGTVPIATCRIA